jgi:hypothetical protein
MGCSLVRRLGLLERQARRCVNAGEDEWEREQLWWLSLDGDGDLVFLDAVGGVEVGAGPAGGGEDGGGAVDAGLETTCGGVGCSVLGGGLGDVTGVDVGDCLPDEADHEQDEAEREQPFDQGVAALAPKPGCEPRNHQLGGYPPEIRLTID